MLSASLFPECVIPYFSQYTVQVQLHVAMCASYPIYATNRFHLYIEVTHANS